MNHDLLAKNLILCLILVWVANGAGCRHRASATGQAPTPAIPVTVAKPLQLPIVQWDEYTGRLDAIDSVEVRARVSGYLESTHFEEGKIVKKGDLLAIVDPRPFEAELGAAQARLEEAEARHSESEALLRQANAEKANSEAALTLANQRLERAEKLTKQNAVSLEDYDERQSDAMKALAGVEASNARIESAKAGIATATAAIETARSNVELAKLNVNYTQIRAPIEGRISRRYVTEGNLISGGSAQSTLVTTIVSINPIHCYFDADEQAFLKYARLSREGKRESSRDVKNPVYMRLVDEEGFPHLGHMDFVDNRIDPNTGTIRGRAIFPNDDNTLTPGLFAEVRIPGSGRYEAILIPDSAIGSDQAEKFVYVVDQSNAIRRKTIKLGPIVKGLRVIDSGLDVNETFVTRGLQRIYPGVSVAPTEESVQPDENGGLPDDYDPVQPDKWLSRRPSEAPHGVDANNGKTPSKSEATTP